MRRAEKLFHALTAGDVMSRAAVVLPHGMSVVAAARLEALPKPPENHEKQAEIEEQARKLSQRQAGAGVN